jgi:hypothetical protein
MAMGSCIPSLLSAFICAQLSFVLSLLSSLYLCSLFSLGKYFDLWRWAIAYQANVKTQQMNSLHQMCDKRLDAQRMQFIQPLTV